MSTTSPKEALHQVGKAAEVARKRRAVIQSSIRAASTDVSRDLVNKIGGSRLRTLRAAAKTRQLSREQCVQGRINFNRKWVWIPLLSRITEQSYQRALVELDLELASAQAAVDDFESRIVGYARRRKSQAAREKYADELSQLAAAEDWLTDLEARLVGLVNDGVTALQLSPPGGYSRGWLRDLDLLLRSDDVVDPADAAITVINDGLDHSSLDLRWRSRPAPMLRNALSLADRPWLSGSPDTRLTLCIENRMPGSLAGFRLLGRPPIGAPAGLFAPRERRGVPLLPGGLNRPDRIYLPAAVEQVDAMAAAGASVGRKGGYFVDPTTIDCGGPISGWLPFIAQRWYTPLPIELIPSTSWGASLANLLQATTWNEIRRSVIEHYGGHCQVCGHLKNGASVEVHEVWDYHMDRKVDGMRVQKLVGLMSLCKACHLSMHLGFSRMRGREDTAAYRLADINGWSMAEFEQVENWIWANYEIRSRSRWALDVSLVASTRPLVIDKSKWTLGSAGDLIPLDPDEVRSTTRLLGVEYKLGAKGDVQPARMPPSI